MAGYMYIHGMGEIGHVEHIGWVGLNTTIERESNWTYKTHELRNGMQASRRK